MRLNSEKQIRHLLIRYLVSEENKTFQKQSDNEKIQRWRNWLQLGCRGSYFCHKQYEPRTGHSSLFIKKTWLGKDKFQTWFLHYLLYRSVQSVKLPDSGDVSKDPGDLCTAGQTLIALTYQRQLLTWTINSHRRPLCYQYPVSSSTSSGSSPFRYWQVVSLCF